ncbi:NUDIX hydrolase domain-like protein [Macrophomina phaseolina]|uniref:NUDIX hydrolase domain-like protein n=1 Tax=Macrophomina phaseolina TaxID=35725 RepID=A0ABQ8FPY9_9PEZI|nr:NUDIX hydrolase domain-like protein [Macrophomina phaseolina]
MAGSQAPAPSASRQLTAEGFVESAGVVIFTEALDRTCLLHYRERDEWLLPKGRRNCGESRHEAALREAKEETGYSCRLLPVTMSTRAPPAGEQDTALPDEARPQTHLTDPFSLTLRDLGGGRGLKLVWWFVAVASETDPPSAAEAAYTPRFFSCREALERLTFASDRQTLQRAIDIVHACK